MLGDSSKRECLLNSVNNSKHMDHDDITECPNCHAEKHLGSDFVKVTWAELRKNPETGVIHELLMCTCKGCGHAFSREVFPQQTDKPQ